MEIDSQQEPGSQNLDLPLAVRVARTELAASVEALTQVLQLVADSGPDKSAYDATRAERDRRAHNLAQAQQPPNVTAPATPAADAAAAAAAATLADGKGTTVKGASLAPVLAHLVNLRAAVRTAVRLHAARLAAARQGEDAVSQVERAALVARHAALVDEVRTKNERVKVMIDHLRQLYRDSLSFRNNLNLNYPRNAMPPSTSKN